MRAICIFFLFIGCCSLAWSQKPAYNRYRNFPVVAAIQFQSTERPFKNIAKNFSNIGFRIGTELSYSGRQDWVQSFNIGWIRNKTSGNTFSFYGQAIFRPPFASRVFGEAKLGMGSLHNYRSGKTRLMLPGGLSLGYNGYRQRPYVSPFVSYDAYLVKNENWSPAIDGTVIQVGTRTHVLWKDLAGF